MSEYNSEIIDISRMAVDNEIKAHDWGRYDYQKELLRIIIQKQDELDVRDCEGHIWWAKFEELVKSIKP